MLLGVTTILFMANTEHFYSIDDATRLTNEAMEVQLAGSTAGNNIFTCRRRWSVDHTVALSDVDFECVQPNVDCVEDGCPTLYIDIENGAIEDYVLGAP